MIFRTKIQTVKIISILIESFVNLPVRSVKMGQANMMVKGWKSEVGMKRLSMFKERYPNIKLYLIDETEYKNVISKTDYLRIYTEQIKLI